MNLKKNLVGSAAGTLMLGALIVPALAAKPAANTNGFNEFGYNYNVRVFVGPADGVDKVLDGKVWGDPTYANDHLVMKWNAQWDNCNANNTPETCLGAWTDNEWNGNVPGGSGYNDVVFTAPFEGAEKRASWTNTEQIVSPKVAAPVLFYLNKSL